MLKCDIFKRITLRDAKVRFFDKMTIIYEYFYKKDFLPYLCRMKLTKSFIATNWVQVIPLLEEK